MFSQRGPYGDTPFPEPVVYSFTHMNPQLKSSPTKQEENLVAVHGAPGRRKAYIQWGGVRFSKGIPYDTAVTTPVPCSLQHDTFPLGLGRPEARLPACVEVTLTECPIHTR
jgi:hypothetical protein